MALRFPFVQDNAREVFMYTCHHCGLVAELKDNTANPQPVPTGWTKNLHIDGSYYWLCPGCSSKEVITYQQGGCRF